MFNFVVGIITIVVFYKAGKYIYEVFHDIDIFRKKKKRDNNQ